MSSIDAQYGIAIHTSSPDLGLAISNFAGDSRQQVWNLGRDLSAYLHTQLAEFLKPQTWSDLAFMSVAIGPGGYTGTRIGVVAARTIAQQLNIPLFGVSSLAAVARSEVSQSECSIAVQMPAQRGELYVAIYHVTPDETRALLPDAVMTPIAWQQTLETWKTPYKLIYAESNQGRFVGEVLAIAAQDWQKEQRPHWSEALPFYGQHPVEL